MFITDKSVLSNGSKSLARNPCDCTILDCLVFDTLILADELFTKALQSFES